MDNRTRLYKAGPFVCPVGSKREYWPPFLPYIYRAPRRIYQEGRKAMRGILRVMTLPAILCVLCITVAFGAYACVHHRRGAVPEALLASLMAAEP